MAAGCTPGIIGDSNGNLPGTGGSGPSGPGTGGTTVLTGGGTGNGGTTCSTGAGGTTSTTGGGAAGGTTGAATGIPCAVQMVFASRCQGCHSSTPTSGAPMPLVTL